MKKCKTALFIIGIIVIVGLTVVFGYLGFNGKKIQSVMKLSYTDEISVVDGIPEINHSGVEFINENSNNCILKVKWGSMDGEYSFLTMVKIIAPSGDVVTFVTGDVVDSELVFELDEKGTYRIESDYFFDVYSLCEEVNRLLPEGNQIEAAEDGSFDGFVFTGKDGEWVQCYEINITTSN